MCERTVRSKFAKPVDVISARNIKGQKKLLMCLIILTFPQKLDFCDKLVNKHLLSILFLISFHSRSRWLLGRNGVAYYIVSIAYVVKSFTLQ